MNIRRGEHVVVLGVTGSGKTYWVLHTLIPAWSRVIVVDTEDYDFTSLPEVGIDRALSLARGDKAFKVRIGARGDRGPEDAALMEHLGRGLLRDGHDLLLVFDEVTDFGDAAGLPRPLRSLVRKSRKRGISLVMLTQRPAMLSKDAYTQASHVIVFALNDYDAEAVRPYAPWVKERLPMVPRGSYRYLYQGPDGRVTCYSP